MILVGCEESGVLSKAFRERGMDAYSCDILPTRGDPRWHIQADIKDVVQCQAWDLIILHPDCTALAVSGNRWYGKCMPRHRERTKAIAWTKDLWNLAKKHSEKVALENPKSVIFSHIDAEVQFIQPWQFGHGEKKLTGFALQNLPKLKPTNIVGGRENRVWKMGPSTTRKRDRSRTYEGIAQAIAKQWGAV